MGPIPIESPTSNGSNSTPTGITTDENPTAPVSNSTLTGTIPVESPTASASSSPTTGMGPIPIESPTSNGSNSTPTGITTNENPTASSSNSTPTGTLPVESPTPSASVSPTTGTGPPPIESPTSNGSNSTPSGTTTVESPAANKTNPPTTGVAPVESPTNPGSSLTPVETKPVESPTAFGSTGTSLIESPTSSGSNSTPAGTGPVETPMAIGTSSPITGTGPSLVESPTASGSSSTPVGTEPVESSTSTESNSTPAVTTTIESPTADELNSSTMETGPLESPTVPGSSSTPIGTKPVENTTGNGLNSASAKKVTNKTASKTLPGSDKTIPTKPEETPSKPTPGTLNSDAPYTDKTSMSNLSLESKNATKTPDLGHSIAIEIRMSPTPPSSPTSSGSSSVTTPVPDQRATSAIEPSITNLPTLGSSHSTIHEETPSSKNTDTPTSDTRTSLSHTTDQNDIIVSTTVVTDHSTSDASDNQTSITATHSDGGLQINPTPTGPDSQNKPTVTIPSSTMIKVSIESPSERNSFPYLLIAIVGGIFLLIVISLILTVIVGFVLKRRRKQRTKTVWHTELGGGNTYAALPTRDSSSGNSSPNNNRVECTNPRMYSDIHSDDTMSTASATVIPSSDSENGVTLTPEPCKKIDMEVEEDMEAAVLEMSINNPPLVSCATASPAYVTIDVLEQSTLSVPSTNSAILLESCTDVKDAPEVSEIEHIYSAVHRIDAPVVPPKSSDLKHYLATCAGFNEGVYSECIDRSDFTHPSSEDEAIPAQVYAPIYPSITVDSDTCQQPAEVTSANITERVKIGRGHFGDIVSANTTGLVLNGMQLSTAAGDDDNDNTSILVAVKKLNSDPSQSQQEVFDMETKFLSQIRHPNVASLLGVCYSDNAFIVMEYTKEGNLNQFLKEYTDIASDTSCSETQITFSTLISMASQIASAMQYLAQQQFVHRDIATRSCLITNDFTIKVADLGINEELYGSHYYKICGNKLLPIRWMATECFDGKFSEKSDVFSFGITMWELFTLAEYLPYRHLSDQEVIHNSLKKENRQFPIQPSSCPHHVYQIMERCWCIDFQERVSFSDINVLLQTCII